MNNITISLSNIENQLLLFDGRLTSIETCLCNMYHVATTPNPSFETSFDTSTTFSVSEFPTDTNVSSPTEAFPVTQFSKDTNLSLIPAGEVVVSRPRNQIQTPPNSKRTATTTSISPLVLRLPQATATNLKKIEARDRTQYLRCGMDQLFTQEEMAASNIDGKRKKRKLDETRVYLLKRKLKFIIVWFLVLEIPCFSNNLN